MILAAAILPTAPAFAQFDDWPYPDRHDGVHLRILNDYELPAGATSREPIVIIAGSATIDGRAQDDVVSIVGILLLVAFPFILGAAGLFWVAGYPAVAANIGARLRGRAAGVSGAPILDVLIGFALRSGLTPVAHTVAIGSGSGPLIWMLRGPAGSSSG